MFHINEQGFLFGGDERPLYFWTEKKGGRELSLNIPWETLYELLYFVNYS